MIALLRALFSLTVLLAWLAGCSQPAPAPASAAALGSGTSTRTDDDPAPSALDARLLYELLLGEISLVEGQPHNASAYVLLAARRTGDEALYRRATEIAIQSRTGSNALEAVRAWHLAHPDSLEAQRFELQVLLALGRVSETSAPLQSMLVSLPEDEKESFVLALPALYQRVADPNEATQTVEAALSALLAERRNHLTPAAWTTVGRMRLNTGDTAGALAAATLGQNADQQSQWPVLLALQLFGSAREPRAEALVQRHLKRADARPEVRTGYARALVELGRFEDAQNQLASLIDQHPEHAEAWLLQGLLQLDRAQDTQAEQSLQHYLQMTEASSNEEADAPDHSLGRGQAQLSLARLTARLGRDGEALHWLEQIELPEQLLPAAMQRAALMARRGEFEQARQIIHDAPAQNANDTRLKLLTEAQLLREHGRAEESYALLTEALASDPDDESLLYDTAMAAERLDLLDDMERLLRRLIELKPDASHAYNALGYTLADRGLRLNEARELVQRAAELAPNDGYIQDSLGWIEYRLGHTDRARTILQAAFEQRPDAEIAAHLGEVLWSLDQREAARNIWQHGLRLDPNNNTLHQTIERLEQAQ